MSTRAGTVGEVIDSRVAIYGDPTETFGRIAEVWSGIVGHHINPVEVPLMLIGMKLVRTQVTPDYSDNSDDVEGYLDIFRQLVGEDMVHARTIAEYLTKCEQRDNPLHTVEVRRPGHPPLAEEPGYIHGDGSRCKRGLGGDRIVTSVGGVNNVVGARCVHHGGAQP